MTIRDYFSNVAESGKTDDFQTSTYAVPQTVIFNQIEAILSEQDGFQLVHKSKEYGECLFHHCLGDVTLTITQSSAIESAIGMHVMTKKRFGFPKKWGKSIYALIHQHLKK